MASKAKAKSTTSTKAKRSKTRTASTTPKAAAKTAPKAKVVSTKAKAKPVEAGAAIDAPELGKKELVERIVARSGMKKGEARRAFEATMEVLAEALREGQNLSLPPLGKIKIARTKDTPNGKMVVMRAKLKDPVAASPIDPMPEAAE